MKVFCGIGCSVTFGGMNSAAQNGGDSMNAMESKFTPGARGLYAFNPCAPGTYKVGRPVGRYVVWRSGRAAF